MNDIMVRISMNKYQPLNGIEKPS